MSARARTILIIAVVAVVVVVAGIVAITVTSGGDDDSGGTVEYGTVTVTGEPLTQGEAPEDPDVGKPVPTIAGADYTGKPVSIDPGKDGPMMIVVMAHWCPHCNEEVPKLVAWEQSGNVPEGLRSSASARRCGTTAPTTHRARGSATR